MSGPPQIPGKGAPPSAPSALSAPEPTPPSAPSDELELVVDEQDVERRSARVPRNELPAAPRVDPFVRDNLVPLWLARGLKLCAACSYVVSPATGLCEQGGDKHPKLEPYTPTKGNVRTVTFGSG